MAFMAPHEENEDSQPYYSENSEEEDMQSTYQLQYVEFLKLKEKYKQQVQELNNLKTEKTAMLIKINDLEERLLETQLQLERVSNEKLIHMPSIQKFPTDKTGLGYVPPSTSDTPSTSQTIFVKPVILNSPPLSVDKGKTVMDGEVLVCNWPHFVGQNHFIVMMLFNRDSAIQKCFQKILHCLQVKKISGSLSVVRTIEPSSPDAHLTTVPSVRTTCHTVRTPVRPSIICLDDMHFPSGPLLYREAIVPACIRPDVSAARTDASQ